MIEVASFFCSTIVALLQLQRLGAGERVLDHLHHAVLLLDDHRRAHLVVVEHEPVHRVLVVDLLGRVRGCVSVTSTAFLKTFGSSLARSGPNSLPCPPNLWHATHVATVNICLPLAKFRPPLASISLTASASSSSFHSVRGRLNFRSSSFTGSGFLARYALGVLQIGVEVGDDVERPVHPPPVAGVGADVGVNARLLRRGELQLLDLPRLEQPALEQDRRRRACRARTASPRRRAGWRTPRPPVPIFSRFARRHDHEVVRHDVGVLEDELDRLAGLHDQPLLVEAHLVEERADADDAHADLAPVPCAPPSPRPAASSPASPSPNCIMSSATGVVRSATGSERMNFITASRRAWRVFLRPVARRDAQKRLHRGGAVVAVGDELGDGLERVGFLPANAGEREHRRLADDPFRRHRADLELRLLLRGRVLRSTRSTVLLVRVEHAQR